MWSVGGEPAGVAKVGIEGYASELVLLYGLLQLFIAEQREVIIELCSEGGYGRQLIFVKGDVLDFIPFVFHAMGFVQSAQLFC